MQLPTPKREEDADPMLPLINVVFLLLIFFIMTGAMHAVDYFNVDPPTSSSDIQTELNELVILISSDGRVAIDQGEVDEVDLQLTVSDKLARDADTVFRIKADGRVDAARVVEIMELIEAVGVRSVVLLALEPG